MTGHYFADLVGGLSSLGVSVTSGALAPEPPPAWLTASPRSDYFSLGAYSRVGYPTAVLRLARLLRRRRIDILQTHFFDGAVVGLAAARLARTPAVVVTRHHNDEHWILHKRAHVQIDRLTARLADYVVVPATAVQEHMVDREGLNPELIAVIQHGVNPEAFKADHAEGKGVRDELALGAAFVVGTVGRLDLNKGYIDLLVAAQMLSSEIDTLRILIVGDHPNPVNRATLLSEARRLGLQRHVIFAGYRTDVAACMRAMDVLAHPSHTEAFGLVLIEAMAVGTPVVAAKVGGVPEIVQSGRAGILVPPRNPTSIAEAILALYRNPALRARYVQAGMQVVGKRFTSERMVADHLALYRRILSGIDVPRGGGPLQVADPVRRGGR